MIKLNQNLSESTSISLVSVEKNSLSSDYILASKKIRKIFEKIIFFLFSRLRGVWKHAHKQKLSFFLIYTSNKIQEKFRVDRSGAPYLKTQFSNLKTAKIPP